MGSYLGAALRGPLAAILPHHEGLAEFRRDLHSHPELGFEEHRTSALVAERLRSFGVDEVHTGIGRTGVVAVIHGRGHSRRSIGLRADMDALPMNEENEFAHRSDAPGADAWLRPRWPHDDPARGCAVPRTRPVDSTASST